MCVTRKNGIYKIYKGFQTFSYIVRKLANVKNYELVIESVLGSSIKLGMCVVKIDRHKWKKKYTEE